MTSGSRGRCIRPETLVFIGVVLEGVGCLGAPSADARPCPDDCTCGVVLDLGIPMPYDIMDCVVEVQGLRTQLLFRDDREHYSVPKVPEGQTELLWMVRGGYSFEDVYHVFGEKDPVYPFASLLGVQLLPGTLMVDIGASSGFWPLLLSKFLPELRIIALEPHPASAALANENLRRNGVSEDRALVINAGLTGDGRNITLHEGSFPTQNSIYDPEVDRYFTGEEYMVPSLTLDQILQQAPKHEFAFLKVDCEGCEYEVLDRLEGVTVPYLLECHTHIKAFKGELERCYAIQDRGTERFFYQGAMVRGCPVTYALAQLSSDLGPAWVARHPAPALRTAESILEELPEGLARWQYEGLLHIAPRLGDFHMASALEMGHGMFADQKLSLSLFMGVAAAPGAAELVEGLQSDGRRLLEWYKPVLDQTQIAATFRAGQLLKRAGHEAEAKEWFARAASKGHTLAYLELNPAKPRSGNVAAKDGSKLAYRRAGIMSLIHMESLGLPHNLQLLLLNRDVSSHFDACIRHHQESRLSTWQQEYAKDGREYDLAEAYRFRSWWHSAMVCWLDKGQR